MVDTNKFESADKNNEAILAKSYILKVLCICRSNDNDELRNNIARVFSSLSPAESEIEVLREMLINILEEKEIDTLLYVLNDKRLRDKTWESVSRTSFFGDYNGVIVEHKHIEPADIEESTVQCVKNILDSENS